jgi:hypothetical protein
MCGIAPRSRLPSTTTHGPLAVNTRPVWMAPMSPSFSPEPIAWMAPSGSTRRSPRSRSGSSAGSNSNSASPPHARIPSQIDSHSSYASRGEYSRWVTSLL